MPKHKIDKPEEIWDVLQDGRRVGSAPSEAKATSLMREMIRPLPQCMSGDFKVAQRKPAQSTTA